MNVGYCNCCVLLNLYTLCVEGNVFVFFLFLKTRITASAALLLHVRLAGLKSARELQKKSD